MQSRLNKLQQWLKGQTYKHVYYLSDELYVVQRQKLTVAVNASASPKLVIVARHLYEEVTQWYPITKKSDVLKRVQLEQEKDGFVGFEIGKAVNDKTPVTYFYYANNDIINQAWVVIPETVVLGQSLEVNDVVSYQSPVATKYPDVFLAKSHNGIHSVLSGGMLKKPEHFAHSQGLQVNRIYQWSQTQAQQQLIDSIGRLTQCLGRGFFNSKALKTTAKKWRLVKVAAIATAAITLYLLIMNQALTTYVDSRQATLTEKNSEARVVLNIQSDIDRMSEQFSKRLMQMEPGHDPIQLWQVLAPLMSTTLTVNQVEWENSEYRVRIEADSATTALQQLLDNKKVAKAEFSTAVRRQRNKEVATIKLSLQSDVDNG